MEIYENLFIESLPNEEWRDVVGWEGLYQVSNLGRVKSLPRPRNAIHPYITKERILRPRKVGKDREYLSVALCYEGKYKQEKVHRLVAKAFVPNPNNYTEVNHKDENKGNNVALNLEWCSRSYNVNYGSGNAKRIRTTIESVLQYTLDGIFVAEYNSFAEAAKAVGSASANISHVVNGDYKTHKGYVWKRKEPKKTKRKQISKY
jgi:hypothetical protein